MFRSVCRVDLMLLRVLLWLPIALHYGISSKIGRGWPSSSAKFAR
jgi:hypothetical protein